MMMGLVAAAIGVATSLAQADEPAASGIVTADAKTRAPRIQFTEPVFDAGTLTAGAVVRHDYVFTNTGTGPLTVATVEPSCGCTTIETWTPRLEAGQSGTIPIYFDSTGLTGEISRWIIVGSNDPEQPRAMLTLKAVVQDAIELSPGSAIFTPAAGALTRETKIIRITNRTKEPLVLSEPKVGNRAFAAELKTTVAGKEFELRVTAVPPFATGTVRGAIRIKTNFAQVPVVSVEAVAVVRVRMPKR